MNVTAILTGLIIAKNAKITFLQGNELLIMKEDGTVTAGVSGSDLGQKIRFWSGGLTPELAPYRVTELGELFANNAHVSGEINATSGHFENVTIKGRLLSPFTYMTGKGSIAPTGKWEWKYTIGKDSVFSANNNLNYIINANDSSAYYEVTLPSDLEFAGMSINIYNDGVTNINVKQSGVSQEMSIPKNTCIRFTCIATETKFIMWVRDMGSYWLNS